MKSKVSKVLVVCLLVFTIMLSFGYLFLRTIFVIVYPDHWYEILWASLFLVAEAFGLMHSINYFVNLALIISPKSTDHTKPLPNYNETSLPPVAVVVPSYHEPLSVLKDTLISIYNLSYQNKHVYLLDDSRYDLPWDTPEKVAAYKKDLEEMCRWFGVNLFRRKWRKAKAGIINDFLKFRKGEKLDMLEFFPFQKNHPSEIEKYLVIFDADMNPFPEFINPLIGPLEEDPNLAFVQTPQYYSNFETNRIARAAGLQQVIFFEYICDGKGMKNAMFCCGTNVMMRIEALNAVGGFNESSVTEDFATSIQMQLSGMNSMYYNSVSAFGSGPEDLGAFFKQQFRWSLGTLGIAKKLPLLFFKNRSKMNFLKWWEYFISSTYYLTGWFYFIMFLFPVMYIFFNIPTFFLNPNIYLAVLIPYTLFSFFMVIWTLKMRDYKPLYLLSSVLIAGLSYPVYIKASISALFGIHSQFVVTPKGQCEPVSLFDLWPQLLTFFVGIAAITWTFERLYFEQINSLGLIGNLIWCIYNTSIFGAITYFNNPEGKPWFASSSSLPSS